MFMIHLPFDILAQIVDYLHIDEYYTLKKTCKTLYRLNYRQRMYVEEWCDEFFDMFMFPDHQSKQVDINRDFIPALLLRGTARENDDKFVIGNTKNVSMLEIALWFCFCFELEENIESIFQHPFITWNDERIVVDEGSGISTPRWPSIFVYPLHIARKYGHTFLIRASGNILCYEYKDIFQLDCPKVQMDVFKTLYLDSGLYTSAARYTQVVYKAFKNRNMGILELAKLSNGGQYPYGDHSFESAIRNGDMMTAKFIVELTGYRPNLNDVSIAFTRRRYEFISYFDSIGLTLEHMLQVWENDYKGEISYYNPTASVLLKDRYDILVRLLEFEEFAHFKRSFFAIAADPNDLPFKKKELIDSYVQITRDVDSVLDFYNETEDDDTLIGLLLKHNISWERTLHLNRPRVTLSLLKATKYAKFDDFIHACLRNPIFGEILPETLDDPYYGESSRSALIKSMDDISNHQYSAIVTVSKSKMTVPQCTRLLERIMTSIQVADDFTVTSTCNETTIYSRRVPNFFRILYQAGKITRSSLLDARLPERYPQFRLLELLEVYSDQ